MGRSRLAINTVSPPWLKPMSTRRLLSIIGFSVRYLSAALASGTRENEPAGPPAYPPLQTLLIPRPVKLSMARAAYPRLLNHPAHSVIFLAVARPPQPCMRTTAGNGPLPEGIDSQAGRSTESPPQSTL